MKNKTVFTEAVPKLQLLEQLPIKNVVLQAESRKTTRACDKTTGFGTSSTFCVMFVCIFMSLTLTTCDLLDEILGDEGGGGSFTPNTEKMVAALKEALTKGAEGAGNELSITGAFYNNMARRIPLPPEAQSIRDKLSNNILSQAVGG